MKKLNDNDNCCVFCSKDKVSIGKSKINIKFSSILFKGFLALIILLGISNFAFSQATTYAHTDSIKVTTTAFDSTFTERWQTASLFSVGCDLWLKMAFSSLDTSLTSDQWLRLDEGVTLTITKNTFLGIQGLRRLSAKAVADSGVVYIVGTKLTDK